MIQVLVLSKSGVCEHKDMTHQQLLSSIKQHKLSLRDQRTILRATDLKQNVAILMPRPSSQCFIFDMEHIKLICFKDNCVILNSEEKAAQVYVAGLKEQFKFVSNESEMIKDEVTLLDFEHVILEYALENVTQKFRRHLSIIKPSLEELLQQIELSPRTNALRKLHAVKKSLIEFQQKVDRVKKALRNILGKGEDMDSLYLTESNRTVGDHEEIELLLGSYLADMEDIEIQIRIIIDMIEDTDQFISVHLDSVRNEMIKMGLFLEMGALVMAFGAVMAGIFGMNFPNFVEGYENAFNSVCLSIFVSMTLLFLGLYKTYQKLEADTTSAQSFSLLRDFYTYADDLEYNVHSKTIKKSETTDVTDQAENQKIDDFEYDFYGKTMKKKEVKEVKEVAERITGSKITDIEVGLAFLTRKIE